MASIGSAVYRRPMVKWEYTSIAFDASMGFFKSSGEIDLDAATAKLNELGAQGWELTSAFDTNVQGGRTGRVVLLLKRPTPAP